MGKGVKGLLTLGVLGGAAFGGLKAFEQYVFLQETHNNVILFNGEKLIYDEVYEGDSVAAIASRIEIDLREAEFDADFSNLDIYGAAAGFKIMVPDDIKIIASGINKASGIMIKVDDTVEGKVLNINYDLTASGLLVVSHRCEEETCEDEAQAEEDEAKSSTVLDDIEVSVEATAEEVAEVLEASDEEITEE